MTRSVSASLVAVSAVFALLCGVAGAQQGPTVIRTEHAEVTFEDGWLIAWQNKQTGERFDFGKLEDLDPANTDDLPYIPGAWWADWKTPSPSERAAVSWSMDVKPAGEDAVELTQQASNPNGEIHSLQWGLRVPYDQIDAIHWPRGLAPARMSGKGYPESLLAPARPFNKRIGALIGSGLLRHQYYVIQGRQGGLLIYMDNPDLQHHMALEFKGPENDVLTISNRSILPPPWRSQYTGARWVIRQYAGDFNVAAQIYQDYVAKAYDITPLSERPTAWVQDLGLVLVGRSPWLLPEPVEGMHISQSDYSATSDWEQSVANDVKYLEDLAKVIDPSKVMFYIPSGAWNQGGSDLYFPDYSVSPYFAAMAPRVRRMGYHVMLHMHCHLVHEPTLFFQLYIKHTATQQGKGPDDIYEGVGICALSNHPFIQKDKEFGNAGATQRGINRRMTGYLMNPAHAGWRNLQAYNIVAAVKATEADAVHLDVPNVWVDLRSDLYGMNQMEGLREFLKTLRKALDENGLEHVAIATELTPFEGFMKYIDLSQNSRDASARARAEAWLEGGSVTGEELVMMQTGKEFDEIMKARQAQQQKRQAMKGKYGGRQIVPEAMQKLLAESTDLGMASIDNMVIAPFIQSYPHLGAAPGNTLPGKALSVWYSLTHDVMPHQFELKEEVEPFEYGKIALARFWSQESIRLMQPKDWERGDVARYRLKDGRVLRIWRTDAQTLRLAFTDGQVLADLDLLEGWKNADLLLSTYGPTAIRQSAKDD